MLRQGVALYLRYLRGPTLRDLAEFKKVSFSDDLDEVRLRLLEVFGSDLELLMNQLRRSDLIDPIYHLSFVHPAGLFSFGSHACQARMDSLKEVALKIFSENWGPILPDDQPTSDYRFGCAAEYLSWTVIKLRPWVDNCGRKENPIVFGGTPFDTSPEDIIKATDPTEKYVFYDFAKLIKERPELYSEIFLGRNTDTSRYDPSDQGRDRAVNDIISRLDLESLSRLGEKVGLKLPVPFEEGLRQVLAAYSKRPDLLIGDLRKPELKSLVDRLEFYCDGKFGLFYVGHKAKQKEIRQAANAVFVDGWLPMSPDDGFGEHITARFGSGLGDVEEASSDSADPIDTYVREYCEPWGPLIAGCSPWRTIWYFHARLDIRNLGLGNDS